MKDKVLSDTKAQLIDIMKCDGEISVEEGADALNLASTTVRQHLGKLEDQGFVKTRHKRYGRGRPLKMYSLTEDSDVWYESQDSDLLAGLIGYLEEHGGEEFVSEYFDEVADQYLKTFERYAEGRSGSRETLLLQFMGRRGFVTDCARSKLGDDVKLCFCHCPRRAAAESSEVVCMAERSFLERALGYELTRTQHIVDGDPVCEYQMSADLDDE